MRTGLRVHRCHPGKLKRKQDLNKKKTKTWCPTEEESQQRRDSFFFCCCYNIKKKKNKKQSRPIMSYHRDRNDRSLSESAAKHLAKIVSMHANTDIMAARQHAVNEYTKTIDQLAVDSKISNHLSKLGSWDFDAIALSECTKRPLVATMTSLLSIHQTGLEATMLIDQGFSYYYRSLVIIIVRWLLFFSSCWCSSVFFFHRLKKKKKLFVGKFISFFTAIEDLYLDNPYHNSVHGADVAANM